MPDTPALDFLLARRSRPARTLRPPVPSKEEVARLLQAAARVPDHGKLAPWRFVVLARPATDRLAALVRARGEALGLEAERIAKSVAQYADADLAVVVVASPKGFEKVPATEQAASAAAACMQLLNAATAAGWGANWLTGWPVYDAGFLRDGLGIEPPETVAGVVHIGTPAGEGPDRPRPDAASLTTWVEA